MNKTELIKRYLFFLAGLFVNSFGGLLSQKPIWEPLRSPASLTPSAWASARLWECLLSI